MNSICRHVLLCLLLVTEAKVTMIIDRKWQPFAANMTVVFSSKFTEITTQDAGVCVLHASRSPPANVACRASSRCVWASVDLLRSGGVQTEAFSCWASQVCSHEEALLKESEVVSTSDPSCFATRNLMCSKQGLIPLDGPPPRMTCTAPFTQHAFGCMYDSSEFSGTYCEARSYCERLGARLASPETQEDTYAMMAYYYAQHKTKETYYVGLHKVDGAWRWPANQRDPGPARTGEWGPLEPNDGGNAGVMFPTSSVAYKIGDVSITMAAKVICHVWATY